MSRQIIPRHHDWASVHRESLAIHDDGREQTHRSSRSRRRERLRSFSGAPISTVEQIPRMRSKSCTLGPTFESAAEPCPSHQDSHHRSDHHQRQHTHSRHRSIFQRASVSIKGLIHRRGGSTGKAANYNSQDSAAVEEDDSAGPESSHTNAWNRLRRAASFRHPRSSHGHEPTEPVPGFGNWSFRAPIPGVGAEPPIVPQHSGAAAKAAAAVSNEQVALSTSRQSVSISTAFNRWLVAGGSGDDSESGIGIGITLTGSDVDIVGQVVPLVDNDDEHAVISRVDFVGELPVELGVHVLSHLDAAGLATASLVSRTWRAVAANQHVWREAFLREKATSTYATSGPVRPGMGLGVPRVMPENDWKEIYKVREELDARWKGGKMTSVYLNGHTDSIYCVQFDEHKIVTGSRDRTVRVWDMHTYRCRLVIGPPDVVNKPTTVMTADGRPVHYAVLEKQPRAAETVPVVRSFSIFHNASVLCLQYDDQILVTGSSDSTCIMYDMRKGYEPIRRLRHHKRPVLDLAFDSQHIVTCSKDDTLCVWDRATGQMLRQLCGHSGPVNSVQLRGNSIVSCSGDCRVKLWNADSGKNIREFVGHTKGLACSQFSEDGRYVASAGNEKIIRIWDANTGECLREMPAHEGLVRSLHIDSISGRLVSGSYDTDIKVFDLRTGAQLLDLPKWHHSWVLSAKSDYRRIVSTGQAPKILIMDFGGGVDGIERLETSMDPRDEVLFG